MSCSPVNSAPSGYRLYEGSRPNVGTAVLVDFDGSGDDRGSVDAVILTDRNRDGRVEIPRLAELRAADRDGDGVISGQELVQVRLWFDRNGDGRYNSGDGMESLADPILYPQAELDMNRLRLYLGR